MTRWPLVFAVLLLPLAFPPTSASAQETFQHDVLSTSEGDLTITFVGHGTLMFRLGHRVVHVDPVGREADYATMPDTENTPEMKALQDIDVAFLPMNLPYTMTPEMVADAARALRPRVLYPYHYGDTDPGALVRLLEGEEGIEVRVRDMR